MKQPVILAGIDLGSNAVKLKIVQYQDGLIKKLEDISTELPLGDEVFRGRIIGDDSTEKLLSILEYFSTLMKEYDVDHSMAVATSSFRRAHNRLFISDLIRRRTGIHLKIIEDSYEKFLTYKSMKDSVDDYERYRKKGTVLVELTSGGCDITLYRNGKLLRNDEIGIGSQALKNKLKAFLKSTPNYMDALESFIETKIDYISKLLKKKSIQHYLAVGGEIKTIRDTFFEGEQSILREDFLSFFDRVKVDNTELIEKSIASDRDWHEMLASIIFFKVFLEILGCREIVIPEISLRDGLIAQLIDELYPEEKRYEAFNEDPFHASYMIAKRFGIHTTHAKYLEQGSLKILEALSEDFNFDQEDRATLRHASHLHEIGKSIDLTNYYQASMNMVKGMRLFSLSEAQQERIYQVLSIMNAYYGEKDSYFGKPLKDVQLASVLLLMDALDASKNQSMRIMDVEHKKETLIIHHKKLDDMTIEKEALEEVRPLVSQVFGLKLLLEERS